jgi:hypothetical protein
MTMIFRMTDEVDVVLGSHRVVTRRKMMMNDGEAGRKVPIDVCLSSRRGLIRRQDRREMIAQKESA